MTNFFDAEITADNLVLWAMRICGSNISCVETLEVIHDWFGRNTVEFIENIQLLYWVNLSNGPIDCRFLPCIGSGIRAPEKLLFDAIDAQMHGDSSKVHFACQKLAGNLSEFAQSAIEKIANLIKKNISYSYCAHLA